MADARFTPVELLCFSSLKKYNSVVDNNGDNGASLCNQAGPYLGTVWDLAGTGGHVLSIRPLRFSADISSSDIGLIGRKMFGHSPVAVTSTKKRSARFSAPSQFTGKRK